MQTHWQLQEALAWRTLLRMRVTEQRKAIHAAFRGCRRPLSPGDVLALASKRVRSINLTTVYRNLKAMLESGDVIAVAVLGKSTRYELSGLDHHHHFLCEKCDRLFDLPGCPGSFQDLAPRGFKVTAHELMLTGRCKSCA